MAAGQKFGALQNHLIGLIDWPAGEKSNCCLLSAPNPQRFAEPGLEINAFVRNSCRE